jgi:drug/metabolite transporter (DMT)-like permease
MQKAERRTRAPAERPRAGRRRWSPWWPFTLLVLAGATRWMLIGLRPEAESTLPSEALGCAWAALVSLMLLRRGPARVSLRRSWRGLLAGSLLLGGPQIGLLLQAHGLDAGGLTIALALTPVVITVAAAALGTGAGDGITGRLWPGLAAVSGLLLVLVEPNLSNARSDVAFALAPVLTGTGAALLGDWQAGDGQARKGSPSRWNATTALTGATVVFGVACLVLSFAGTRGALRVSVVAIACDGILALLSVHALLGLGATRWAAQFALLPLLILLESVTLMRLAVTARWLVGGALLVFASLSLLVPPSSDPADEDPATAR